jgi:anti-anti-sigma factor
VQLETLRGEDEPSAPTVVLEQPLAGAETGPTGSRPGTSPTEDERREAELFFVQAPGSLLGSARPLGREPISIGRGATCDIVLEPRSISRVHAHLEPLAEGRWKVLDAGSQNGIEVNGKPVREAVVTFGDRLGFGTEVVAILRATSQEDVAPPSDDPEPSVSQGLSVMDSPSHLHPSVTRVQVVGRVDGYSYSHLRAELTRVVDRGSTLLLLDLGACLYCDSNGLGVLVNVSVALRQKGGALCAVALSPQIRDAFRLLRIESVVDVANTEAEGVQRLLAPRRGQRGSL